MNIQDLRNLVRIDNELQEVEKVLIGLRFESPIVDTIITIHGVGGPPSPLTSNLSVDRATLAVWLEIQRDVLKAKLAAGGIS